MISIRIPPHIPEWNLTFRWYAPWRIPSGGRVVDEADGSIRLGRSSQGYYIENLAVINCTGFHVRPMDS